jgi:hypothetical protein
MTTYYVATTGSDVAAGSITNPWKTLGHAAGVVVAGDTVYVRGGTYIEKTTWSTSGSVGSPICLRGYPTETAIISGNDVLAPGWGYLLSISGDYVQVYDLEVCHSAGMGVVLSGANDLAHGLYVHNNYENGILVTGAGSTGSIVEYCTVYYNAMSNYHGLLLAGSWAGGLQAAVGFATGIIFRYNTVHMNWGEGISTYQCGGATLENNISYDNYSCEVYISDAHDITCQRNLVWADPTSEMFTYADASSGNVGIMLGDEHAAYDSYNIQVLNNIAYGCNKGFYWWQGFAGHGLTNATIANNTWVNSYRFAGIQFSAGTHSGVVIEDNITEQDDSLQIVYTVAQAGVTWSHNLWSKTPLAAAAGTGDVVADPKLVKVGSPYTAAYYRLDSSSPAIGAATVVAATTPDYFNVTRDGVAPDLGASEYTAGYVAGTSTLTLQPDATTGKDCCLEQGGPTYNTGAYNKGWIGWYGAAGNYRCLFQFDVTSIPTTATVLSAILTLYREGNDGTTVYSYGAYKLVRAWVEGTGVDSVTGDGADWNTYNGVNNWGTAGCDNTSTDRSSSAEDAHAINYATDNTWSIPVMTQDWVTTPANNKGVLIATTDVYSAQGYLTVYTSDYTTPAKRPQLVVTYTTPDIAHPQQQIFWGRF